MLHLDILQPQINFFSCTIHKQIVTNCFLDLKRLSVHVIYGRVGLVYVVYMAVEMLRICMFCISLCHGEL